MKMFVAIAAASVLTFVSQSSFAGSRAPRFEKVVYIVLENTSVSEAMKNPVLKNFANQSVYFSRFMAETHPSQGNYIAMIAGSTMGVSNDKIVNLPGRHLGDLLEAKGRSWKTYAEAFPGDCFLGAQSGKYVRKHVPFISFTNISTNKARCANIVDLAKLPDDWSHGRLSSFNLVVPDLDNDGHDTGVSVAANWFDKNIVPFLKDSAAMKDTVVILTFDESTYFGANQVYTAVYSPNLPMKKVISAQTDHVGLLRWLENEWNLGNLGRGDATAPPIPGF